MRFRLRTLIMVTALAPAMVWALTIGLANFLERGGPPAYKAATAQRLTRPKAISPTKQPALSQPISQHAEPEVIDASKSLGPLVEAAIKDPSLRRGKIKANFAKAFKLPFGPDELWTMELVTEPEGNHQKSLLIRPCADGRAYIFMVDVEDNKKAFFYHTTVDGKLNHAIWADGNSYDRPMDKARKGFESELAYWRAWLASKTRESSK